MAEGGKTVRFDETNRARFVSSSSVDDSGVHKIPELQLRRSFSLKDLWRNRKKIPRSTLEQELVTCKNSCADLQIRLYETRKWCTKLKQQLIDAKDKTRRLQEENKKVQKELTSAIDSKTEQKQKIETIINTNPYSIYISGSRNVQVGDNNTMAQNDGNMDQLVALEELTEKLTFAVQQNTVERINTECKLRSVEVMKKEFDESLEEIKESFKKLDSNTSKKLKHDIELLEVLTSDRSDEHVITDGISHLKRHVEEKNDSSQLPIATETAITRLVNKFESLKCDNQQFAAMLGVGITEPDIYSAEHPATLDRETCKKILLNWIKKSRVNGAERLLSFIKDYESTFSEEMVKRFEETVMTKHNKECQMPSLTTSETSTGTTDLPAQDFRGQNLQGFPDSRSRFMHQIEGYRFLVDTRGDVKVLSEKVNDICIKMCDMKALSEKVNEIHIKMFEKDDRRPIVTDV